MPGSRAVDNGFLAASMDNRHHHSKDHKLTWVAGVDSREAEFGHICDVGQIL